MGKDKSENPFADGPAYERILHVDKDQIRERHRRDTPPEAAKKGEAGRLLTSKDLFGEIIEEFGPTSAKQAPTRPAAAASPWPTHESVRGSSTIPSADKIVAGAGTTPPKAAARRDTVPAGRPEKDEGPPSEFSLVDLAYSVLLHDDALSREIDRLGGEQDGAESASEYGQYLLLDRIATGGMAEVFRAKRKGVEGFEKTVAVKRILPHLSDDKGFTDMFVDEAKMAAGLSHPNIVQIFELGKISNSYFIAMEYVDGKDLRTILGRAREKKELLNFDLATLIAGRVGSALEYAHRQRDENGRELRIVHRDVSPQNILISREGEVKLADFGIAKAAVRAFQTDGSSLRGKFLYMSPEQAWGRPIDRRSDIFSLGVVLFEMLTGRRLFMSDSEVDILERVREAKVVAPSSLNPAVPAELEAVVLRALRRDPSERYQDASEMLLYLESYLRSRPAVDSAKLARFVKKYL